MSLNSVSIEEEFRKNSALKRSDLQSLKKWCDEKFFTRSCTSSSELALFLHRSYYYLETAKSNIENFYSTRHSLPQLFEKCFTHSGQLKKISDTLAIIPLAKTTREGYKVILIRPLDVARCNVPCTDAIKLFNMILDLNIYEEGTQEGYVFVVDLHGANFFDPSSFDPTAVKKYFDYLQKCAPIRWFGLHFINTVLPFTHTDRFTRMTILQNNYVDATYLHLDLDSLNEVVPLHVLPNEMGGQAGPLKDLHEAQVKKLRQNSLWFSVRETQEAFARTAREISSAIREALKDLKIGIQGQSKAPLAV